MSNPTYRELNDNFELVLHFGASAIALRREINAMAFSKNANVPISDIHAAELNRVAGFAVAERKPLKPMKPRERPTKPLPLL